MKKLLLLLIALTFLAVSCSGSKKAENDADLLPDEDGINDEDGVESDDDEKEGGDGDNSCSRFANSSGELIYSGNGKRCDCKDGYFWANPGCKKIAFPNICTGQTDCYDNEKNISCPKQDEDFFGQDAQYAKRGFCIPKNFSTDDSVSKEPTVFDNNLKIELTAEYSEWRYTWDEAVKYCEELEYAGHDDWRLPSPQELIAGATCRNDIMLWSSLQANDSDAWAFYSISKTLNAVEKVKKNYLRCVRGEPIDSEVSFSSIDTNLVMDYKNGLMWSMADYISERNWNEAFAECEKSTAGGFSDWRLPNINELSSILNFEKSDPASDFPYPEDMSLYFWASTTKKSDFSYASAVNTASLETIKNIYKTEKNHVICVRNEPCIENYFWDGVKCVESPCNGNPCQKVEHSDGICNLSDSGGYSCGCVENYFQNGEKCVSPCEPNPCADDKNSTGECIAAGIELYFCKCQENYFWGGRKCVNPCEEDTCKGYENSTGECTKASNSFICGCEEGYYWHGSRKGCLNYRPAAANVCTGQNKCYDNEKEIPCPDFGEEFFGQDAQYAKLGYCAPQSFSIDETVPSEPVVIDNNTGNMWQQKIPPVEELYIEDVLAYCENLVYGGYDDWRLPSMEDFMTIADYGRYDPAVNTEYFSDSGSFWTSTMESLIDIGGWFVMGTDYYTIFDFADTSTTSVKTYYSDQGFLNTTEKYPHSYNIRCARGGNAAFPGHHFISETFGKKVMWNNYNDLIFIKADYPYDHLIVETAKYTWKEALKYCSELEYAGISDWRVPNFKELTFNSLGGARTSTTKLANQTSDYAYIYSNLPVKEDNMADTLCVANDPCGKGKFWNGKKCAKNPCAGNPCLSISYSDGLCIVVDEENFACGCVDNYYFWNYDKKECLRSCYNNPCYYDENSDYECYNDKDAGYYCGCKENFSWDPESRKCIFDCNTNPCQNMEHSDGKCHENGNEGSYCGCVEGYAWFPHACLEDLCNPNPCENMANSYGTCEQKYYRTNLGYDIYYRCNCIEGYSWNTKYEECRKTK